ncbi:hypothetical protein [Delftia sp. WSY_7]|uniref:hypothetical protein n=1 Tax=Delftia sp. WSY_7 TaxID=3367202 RepID=UPI00370B7C71
MDTTLGVVGDNRLRFYQDLHFEYDVHGNVTRRTRGNQKAGSQEVLDLTWNADHQLIESNTTRHGVTQATRYAYDPTGRCVAKSDAFCSTHYLWDGDLMVHSQRGTRQALYIYEPGELCATGHHSGSGRGTQHLLVPVRPDWRATGSPPNRAKGSGQHHGLLLVYWSWHLTVGRNILRIRANCLTFFAATRYPLQKANALLKSIQLDT